MRHLKGATHIGVTDPEQVIDATIHLHRRVGHRPMPTFDEYIGCQPRQRLSVDEFAVHYGADPAVVEAIVSHCQGHGLTIEQTHLARRHVRLSGKIKHFNAAMGIDVQTYAKRDAYHGDYQFRSHDAISLPEAIAPHVVGVFGIDSEHRTRRVRSTSSEVPPVASVSPPNTASLTPQQIRTAYNVPSNQATGQTIGIWGWVQNMEDINSTLTAWGLAPNPDITLIFVNGAVMGDIAALDEGILDNTACAAMAPGARIVVYFPNESSASHWVDTFARMIHPDPGERLLDVITMSIIIGGNVESPDYLPFLQSTESLFEDAAAQSITMFCATGDAGSANYATDGGVYAASPCVSAWLTNCGGTVLGDIKGDGTIFTEWAWNGSGGGVSTVMPSPTYQVGVSGLPNNLVTGKPGRAYPEICAPASPASGMDIYVNGVVAVHGGDGTSCSSPLTAGMFATINAALGWNVGFINPTLYFLQNKLFRCLVADTLGTSFVDAHGTQWGLTAGGKVSVNGVTDTTTNGVIYLLYSFLYDQIWHANNLANWYTKPATSTAQGNWTAYPQNPIPRLVILRDIDGSAGDTDNAFGTSPGYPVVNGFDAVTGWGAINVAPFIDFVKTYNTTPLNRVWVQVQSHTATVDSPLSDVIGPTVLY